MLLLDYLLMKCNTEDVGLVRDTINLKEQKWFTIVHLHWKIRINPSGSRVAESSISEVVGIGNCSNEGHVSQHKELIASNVIVLNFGLW